MGWDCFSPSLSFSFFLMKYRSHFANSFNFMLENNFLCIYKPTALSQAKDEVV